MREGLEGAGRVVGLAAVTPALRVRLGSVGPAPGPSMSRFMTPRRSEPAPHPAEVLRRLEVEVFNLQQITKCGAGSCCAGGRLGFCRAGMAAGGACAMCMRA